ncbi:MAG TPA: hypothetical protein VH678_28280 [Xanthobacteraceae bacterium]|jgi:hypothetical protein
MQTTYVGAPAAVKLHIPRDVVAVLLFCLLGLTVSMAVLSFVPAEELAAILAY